MNISNVTIQDGKLCAILINALNAARFADVSGKDVEAIVAAKKWLADVAIQMASELKKKPDSPSVPAITGFKVKSMGKLPASNSKKKK